VEQSIAYASQIKASNTFFIHMTHDLEYEKLNAELPENMYVAYDGLKLNF
jgi:phosphoribosyl 1,2-cyclic phosphate phosphodiesterase